MDRSFKRAGRGSILALAITALIFGALLPRIAQAYCIGSDRALPNYQADYYSVAKEYRRAQYVALVRVRRERRVCSYDPDIDYDARYDVDVVASFKRKAPHELALFSENSSARFPMEVGETYLAFISPETFPNHGRWLIIDSCGNSGLLAKTSDALRLVRSLATRR